jgi:hypothetical protein
MEIAEASNPIMEIAETFMVKAENLLLVWHYHSQSEQSYYGDSGSEQSYYGNSGNLYGEGGKPFTCVALPLTERAILLWRWWKPFTHVA